MFKLPDQIPTRRDSAQEWADYAEFITLEKGHVSLLYLNKSSSLIEDEILVSGIEDESDLYLSKVDEIASEIKNRNLYTGSKYPYSLANNDYVLQFKPVSEVFDSVYKFLLLCTRVNMLKERVQDTHDGTFLFEELSAVIAQNYFGPKAEVEILGTSSRDQKNFREKLKNIVSKMGEGGQIHKQAGFRPQDDNIDVIVWKGFADRRPSKIIAFGQCKTGTSWQESISELNSVSFCKTWFSSQPVVTPVRLFFTAQYFPHEKWIPLANKAGIVFDRHRIMDYLPEEIDHDLVERIHKWNSAFDKIYSLGN